MPDQRTALPRRAPKIPLNLFGLPFGLAGLAESYTIAADDHHAPAIVGIVLMSLSAVTWLAVLSAYLRHALRRPTELAQDLLDPIAAPFASLALITPMLLAGTGLYPHAETAGRVVTDVFVVLTVVLGGWFTGQWIYGGLDLPKFHPGYFLPTVAGGLVASASAGAVGQVRLAEAMFGLGVVCWIVVGSLILGRLLFCPMLPPPLQPTLAIEVAPAAVASLAWFEMYGPRVDPVIAFLAGYGALMVIAQLRLLPAYRRLPFMPSTWAFTFSWSAVATTVWIWLQAEQPAGYRVWQYLTLAAITLLIGAIAARTVVAISRRQLLPAPPLSPPANRAVAANPPVEAVLSGANHG